MTTKRENEDIRQLQKDMAVVKTDMATMSVDMAVVKTDMGYIKESSKKTDKFIDENRNGIATASHLNNKIITGVLGALAAAGIALAARTGGML